LNSLSAWVFFELLGIYAGPNSKKQLSVLIIFRIIAFDHYCSWVLSATLGKWSRDLYSFYDQGRLSNGTSHDTLNLNQHCACDFTSVQHGISSTTAFYFLCLHHFRMH